MTNDESRTRLRSIYLGLRRPILKLWKSPPPVGSLPTSFNSILVISQRRLGDIALEIPSLRLLRQAYPEATLGVVAPGQYQSLLRLACRHQLSFDSSTGMGRKLRETVRKHQWQLAIDLTTDYHISSALLAVSTSASIRIGFANAGRERFFNVVIPQEREHMVDRFQRPLRVLGVGNQPLLAPLEIPELPVDLPGNNTQQKRVGLHAGARSWTQRWPPEYFGRLAKIIHERGHQCLVLGLREERDLVEKIIEQSNKTAQPVWLSGDILEFAAVLKRLNLLICNNSGPLHLACLLNVPTLSFMGPTVKERWWPLGGKARVLRRGTLPCIGCNMGYCRIGTHACMREITPEMAFEACISALHPA
jgi:ADP-heptose:LPS heptosyltransferase